MKYLYLVFCMLFAVSCATTKNATPIEDKEVWSIEFPNDILNTSDFYIDYEESLPECGDAFIKEAYEYSTTGLSFIVTDQDDEYFYCEGIALKRHSCKALYFITVAKDIVTKIHYKR
jgi:hypothetical protein